MKFGLDDATLEKLSKVFETNPKVDKALIFGSRAKGNYRDDSDIDIALKGYDISLNDVIQLSAALEDEGISYKLDLVNYDSIKEPALIEHIDRVEIAIYSRWKEYRIKELLEKNVLIIGDGYRAKNSELSDSGIPFARAGNIDNGFDFSGGDFFPVSNLYKVGAKRSREGDTVFTSKGTVGRFAYVKHDTPEFVYSPQLCYWRSLDGSQLSPSFLYYWMHSPEFLSQVNSVKGQTDMADYVSLTDQRGMKISIPPINYQKEIALVLKNLDDKIEVLHRQNKTLEALANALFRDWFVDNADESLGELCIGDVAELNPESISKNYSRDEIEYLDTGSITEGIISEFQPYPLKDAPSRAQRIVRENDVVYSLVRPIQRHYGLLTEVKENTIASTGFCVIRSQGISPHFIYLLLTSNDAVEMLDMIAEGSTSAYPSLKPSDIGGFRFPKPSEEKLADFSEMTAESWRKIKSNSHQIRTLTKLRNVLLPKLMSGDVRVRRAD